MSEDARGKEDAFVLTDEEALRLRAKTNSNEYVLIIQNMKITEIGDLSKMEKLRSINLGCNRITRVSGLEKLKDLRSLQLYNNALVSLRGVGKNSRLEILQVHSNEIEEIPVGISNLKLLREFRIGYNRLTSLCYHLTHCRNLRNLELQHNKVESLNGISSLRNLERLDASSNALTTESLDDLRGCSKLQVLRLSGNKITSVTALKSVQSLRVLHISENSIESLRDVPFLPNLNELYMRRNLIRALGKKPLRSKFPQLDTIDLAYNCLSDGRHVQNVLGPKAAPKLRELWLEGNEIDLSACAFEEDNKSQTLEGEEETKATKRDVPPRGRTLLRLFPQLDAMDGRPVNAAANGAPTLPRPVSRRSSAARNFLSRDEICEKAQLVRKRFQDFRVVLDKLGKNRKDGRSLSARPPRRPSGALASALAFSAAQQSESKGKRRTVLATTDSGEPSRSKVARPPTLADLPGMIAAATQRPRTAPAGSNLDRGKEDNVVDADLNRRLLTRVADLVRPKTAAGGGGRDDRRRDGGLRTFRIPAAAMRSMRGGDAKRMV